MRYSVSQLGSMGKIAVHCGEKCSEVKFSWVQCGQKCGSFFFSEVQFGEKYDAL